MVNQNRSTILKLLKAHSSPLSGEEISSKLNISRVAVWKHMQALHKMGYSVTSSPSGYAIVEESDMLFPWEFNNLQNPISFELEATSTMDMARKAAQDGQETGIFIAEQQHHGHGRCNRMWSSSPGGAYFSILIAPAVHVVDIWQYVFLAAVILTEQLRKLEVAATIKWPNDILVGSTKIAGILAETAGNFDSIRWLIIGIGVNLKNPLPGDFSTSVLQETGKSVGRKDFIENFCRNFFADIQNIIPQELVTLWKKYNCVLGKKVRISTETDTLQGTALDINAHGALTIKSSNNVVKNIYTGDCFIQ